MEIGHGSNDGSVAFGHELRHDLDAFVACFAPEYQSDQSAHPSRAFRGSEQVRENWMSVFAGVPDFTAELLSSATTDDGVEI